MLLPVFKINDILHNLKQQLLHWCTKHTQLSVVLPFKTVSCTGQLIKIKRHTFPCRVFPAILQIQDGHVIPSF